jgi:hypothetical protein
MGFSHEAEAYVSYIFQRIKEAKARHGALPIMFTMYVSLRCTTETITKL